MKNLTTNQIRKMWLDFFSERGHKVEESASLIPNNDPTLLWINAGVAPLKKYFDGSVIPSNPRIVNAQKCIRTNDIDNVGKTARHHTFFEMLGNFSIGDYFRDEIIPWAYELLTSEKYYGMDPEKLYMTIYPDDMESKRLWMEQGVKEDHIIPCEHNFWEIGAGPSGPDTEIFYDRGIKYGDFDTSYIADDIENDRYIEIWNIVFSQFNAKPGTPRSEYKELPSKNIDTGMGLERMACVIQGVETNYETDTFMEIIHEIEKISNVKYIDQMAFKVIADHIRTVTFAVNDGALLSNEGRGYVLRRLLRRAVKYGKQLGIEGAFLYQLVDQVVTKMSVYYTSLNNNVDLVKKVIKLEEDKFLETLSLGEKILEEMMHYSTDQMINGKDAFTLYDTYGFPLELTEEIANQEGYTVDKDGFKEEMNLQKERARSARKNSVSMKSQNSEFLNFKDKDTFIGYEQLTTNTTVLKSFEEGVVLKETPFYAESGGQVADQGIIRLEDKEYNVLDVQKLPNGQFLHVLENHHLQDGDDVYAEVDEHIRKLTMYNHSCTHLLFAALREIVGSHVSQQGSQVSSEALRFDFNNFDNLDDQSLLNIEQLVNEKIKEATKVSITEQTIDEAKEMGAIAEFGEKYSDKVRVVNMGYTIDLCGGTHVANIGDIERFALASIESKGSGIYRIVGYANDSVDHMKNQLVGFHKEMDKLLKKADNLKQEAKTYNIDLEVPTNYKEDYKRSYQAVIDIRSEFDQLGQTIRDIEKDYTELKREAIYNQIPTLLEQATNNNLVVRLEDIDKNVLKSFVDRLLENLPNGFVFIANVSDDKVTFIAKSANKNLHAGNIVKEAAILTNGNGGGRPDMAQAGGKDITKVDEAISLVKELIQ